MALATGDNARFVLGYQYVDRDPAYIFEDETFNINSFMKTKHFVVVMIVATVVVMIILALIFTLCVY